MAFLNFKLSIWIFSLSCKFVFFFSRAFYYLFVIKSFLSIPSLFFLGALAKNFAKEAIFGNRKLKITCIWIIMISEMNLVRKCVLWKKIYSQGDGFQKFSAASFCKRVAAMTVRPHFASTKKHVRHYHFQIGHFARVLAVAPHQNSWCQVAADFFHT